MPYRVTRGDILQRARDLGEISTSFNAMLRRWFDASYAEFYDLITETNSEAFIKPDPYLITLVADQMYYSLPQDFYKIKQVLIGDSAGYTPMLRTTFSEVGDNQSTGMNRLEYAYGLFGEKLFITPAPDYAETDGVKVYYIPVPQRFSSDNDLVDGIAGYEEYIVADLCLKNAMREESEGGQWSAIKDRIEAKIRRSSSRDKGNPPMWRTIRSQPRRRLSLRTGSD